MRGHALESLANIYWHYRSAKGAAWPSTSALLLALILKAIVLQEGRTHGQFSRWVDCKRHVVPQTQSCHCSGIPRHRLLPQLWKQCCWRYLESDCLTRTTHARNNSTLFYPPNLKKYKTRKRTTLDIRYGIFKTQQVKLYYWNLIYAQGYTLTDSSSHISNLVSMLWWASLTTCRRHNLLFHLTFSQ